MVEIDIDGKKMAVPAGTPVLEAAQRAGITIPHFCYHKKLSLAASCRMCMVEVENLPRPVPACATPATAGMVVHTHTEKVRQAQKAVMEFLLINHPLDCPVCDQGGECRLQDVAVGYGADKSRYREEKRVIFHKNAGPLISMEEMSRCIHCTRCIRFGREIAGMMELGLLQRGEHAEIATFVGKTIDSELSGNMIDICPVGALTSKPFRYRARAWELSRQRSVSPHDGLGANIIVQAKNGKVLRVLPLENEAVNECWLSDKDRFSYEALSSEARLTVPMIKQGNQWHETDWETALEYVAHGLEDIRKEHGAQAIAALASPHSTLEEMALLGKIIQGLGSNNFCASPRQADFSFSGVIKPWLGMPIADFGKQEEVLIVGSFLRKDHPLLAARLRQSVRKGARVHAINAINDDWLMPIDGKIIRPPSAWMSALGEIALAVARNRGVPAPAGADSLTVSADAERIAASLLSAGRSSLFMGNAAAQHPKASQLHMLMQWIAEQTNSNFGYLTEAANTVGAHLLDVTQKDVFDGPRRAYLLLNAEPALDCANQRAACDAIARAAMVVALSSFKHSLDLADVLLPIAPFTETSGTFVNCEGRAQSFNAAVRPAGQARPAWKVLRVLGNLLGLDGFDYESSEAVRDEIICGETDLSARLTNISPLDVAVVGHEPSGLERIADVPIHFADAIVRRAASLQMTADARPPKVRISPDWARSLDVTDGDLVNVRQEGGAATLAVKVDERVPVGVVWISAAHATTADLGSMFGAITLEKAR